MSMTSKKETITKLDVICRICLKTDDSMSSIFSTNDTDDDNEPILAARITSIAQVEVSPDDGLPIFICQSCRQQVDRFYDFKRLVQISDCALRSYLDGTLESSRLCAQTCESSNDLDYQEFLIENNSADDPKDLFAGNTILVPSGSGTEVWRICSVDGDNDEEKQEPDGTKTKTSVFSKLENTRKIEDTRKLNVTSVKRCTSRKVQPIAIIKKIEGEQPLFFTSGTSNEDREKTSNDYEQSNGITIIGVEESEDLQSPSLSVNKHICQLCLKPFKTLRTLKNHVKDHCLGGKERIQICEMKNKKVRLQRNLEKSHDVQTEKVIVEESEGKYLDPLACLTCDQTIQMSQEFLQSNDRIDRSNDEDNPESAERNESCGEEIEKLGNRDQAIHPDSSLTCATCNKHFRNAQSYKMHLKRHMPGSRFNCLECGKRYYSNSELARHVQLHTGTREYPCQLCEMSFFSKPELNRHYKYHRGEKKFECKICFKTYYESGHLKVHERVHTGEKPFPCTVCDKAFSTKSKLIRHFKIHERDRTM